MGTEGRYEPVIKAFTRTHHAQIQRLLNILHKRYIRLYLCLA